MALAHSQRLDFGMVQTLAASGEGNARAAAGEAGP